jgi:hypothetical protein
MLNSSYDIKDIKLLLELNDSARQTLLILLDQFDGALIGKFNRSGMSNAEKQKMKRGIAELKDKGFITKSDGYQRHFTLNSDLIKAKIDISPEDQYLKSGLYKSECSDLLNILIVIEHFFDDFFNKKFVIKFKLYTETPRIPAKAFKALVDFTEENYTLDVYGHRYGTILNQLIWIAEFIKFYSGSSQIYFTSQNEMASYVTNIFTEIITSPISTYPPSHSAQAKALCKFIRRWFSENYPEYMV